MVRAWIADTGYTPKRPGWLRRLISGIRLFFHRRGWFVSHLSDNDILTILAQSAKAGRKRRYAGAGDGTRYDLGRSTTEESGQWTVGREAQIRKSVTLFP